jgi:hypothetical protein
MKFLQILSGGISFSEGVICQLLGLLENMGSRNYFEQREAVL